LNRVGLHIRLTESFIDVVKKAQRLELPFFQTFLVLQSNAKLAKISDQEIKTFLSEYRSDFQNLYLHGSYWVNLAGIINNGYRSFKRELALGKKLGFTHMVIHSGVAKGAKERTEGINALAHMLNTILKTEDEMQFIIENTAHAKMAVGSDIHDFKILLNKLDHPEKIKFSIDTAHAYVYGYDVGTEDGQDEFINLVDTMVGIDNVALIHLNDSTQKRGSRIDKHAVLGQGHIGEDMLKRFVQHPKMKRIPIVLELPVLPEEQEREILNKVRSWC
jgi:deoxyribonuclease-4